VRGGASFIGGGALAGQGSPPASCDVSSFVSGGEPSMRRLLLSLWRDERGNVVENLGVMLVISIGIGVILAGLSVSLERSGANFEHYIRGVVRP